MPTDAPPKIQSLDRGLKLLEMIATATHPVGLAELTRALGVDRSTAFRLADTLKRRGFIAQAGGKRGYVLGSAFWRLSDTSDRLDSLRQTARDAIVALAEKTGETTHLAVRRATRVFFVDHVLSPQRLGVTICAGRSDALHTTSVGKALLIDCDRDFLGELYKNEEFSKPTPRAVGTLDELAAECLRAKRKGYAVDDEEAHEGIRCIAAPIRDGSGRVIASVGISGPSTRVPKKRWVEFGGEVMKTAAEIGESFGYETTFNTPD